MKTKNQILINFLVFYFSWWLIVTLMGKGYSWAVLPTLIIAMTIHFKFVSDNYREDIKEMAIITALITAVNTILFLFNIVFFHHSILGYLPPIWLITISLIFSTTFKYALAPIRNRWPLQVIAGGALAPITYLAARRYGLIDINEPFSLYYVTHVASWMLLFPACFRISKNLKGN